MPVKSAHTKKTKVKISSPRPKAKNDPVDPEEAIAAIPLKSKIPLEIDEPEAVIGLDEKPAEEDVLVTEEEAEELGLDETGMEEELDPFNDKWEA